MLTFTFSVFFPKSLVSKRKLSLIVLPLIWTSTIPQGRLPLFFHHFGSCGFDGLSQKEGQFLKVENRKSLEERKKLVVFAKSALENKKKICEFVHRKRA